MKVLIYCLTFYPVVSGYSNAFQNLIDSIKNEDIDIDIVTPVSLGNNDEIKINDNVNTLRIPNIQSKRFRGLNNQKIIANYIEDLDKKNNYDFILFETFEHIYTLAFLKKELFKKLAIRVHGCLETETFVFSKKMTHRFRYFVAKKFVFNKLVNIISTSQYHNNFLKKYYYDENEYEIAKRNFYVLPNTIKEKDFQMSNHFKQENKIKLFMLGRMDYDGYLQKGFEDFINALLLLENETNEKLEIIIVGSGEYRSHLIKKSNEFNLPIQFIEKLNHEETLGTMSQADVVILPSRFEGMSMFALEALYTKNLVVFTNTGGIKDMVKDNGYLVEVQNIEELADSLKTITNLTQEQINEMKENSFKHYKDSYVGDIIKNKFLKILIKWRV